MKRFIVALLAFIALTGASLAQTGVIPTGRVPISRGPGYTGYSSQAGPIYVGAAPYNAKCDDTTDDTAAIQAAIDSTSGPLRIILPAGICKITSTIFLKRDGVSIIGQGWEVSTLHYVNLAGGTAISGSTTPLVSFIAYNELSGFYFDSNNASDGFAIGIDITSMSYGTFDLLVASRRVGSTIFYGQGNTGSAPYYNIITGAYFGGGGDQTFFRCRLGTASVDPYLDSNGCNANIIGPIKRSGSFRYLVDMAGGNGNLFSNINTESINDAYFKFNSGTAVATGTSTGSNTDNTLINTAAGWPVSGLITGVVEITGGTGAGQYRAIANNTATTLTLQYPWAVIPDNTSTYATYGSKAYGNKIVNIRTEGDSAENPDFIQANPGTSQSECLNCTISSLGSGLYLRDKSGYLSNRWFGSVAVIPFVIRDPGGGATVNVFPGVGGVGGLVTSDYTLEFLSLSIDATSHGDTATATVVSGATTMFQATVINNSAVSMALPGVTTHNLRPTSSPIYVTVTTGASFSAGRTITGAIGITANQ